MARRKNTTIKRFTAAVAVLAFSVPATAQIGEGFGPGIGPVEWEMPIDVRPRSSHNIIVLGQKNFVIPVAFLGSEQIDVNRLENITFGPANATPIPHLVTRQDINNDGRGDMVLFFKTDQTGITMGATEACAHAQVEGGALARGCNTIRTVSG